MVGQWAMRIGVALFAVWGVLFALAPSRLPVTAPAVHYGLLGSAVVLVVAGAVLITRHQRSP